MRKLLLTVLTIASFTFAHAQQGVQYTAFMFNKLAFNPAYAGSHECPCVSAIHRSQWIAFPGAPNSQSANFHRPFLNNRVGFGLNLQRDQIGPTNSYWANMSYAYRVPLKKGKLSIGLSASMRSYNVDFTESTAINPNDVAVMNGNYNKILPNLGAGIYYLHDKFYAGLSVPYVVKNDLSFSQIVGNSDFAIEEPHYYGMFGLKLGNEKIAVKPAAMIKYVNDAPLDLDLHASVIFYNTVGVGGTYRVGGFDFSGGDSFDMLLHLNFNKFKIGGSYDISLSEVREFSSGTFEIFLEYCLKQSDNKLTNPRFFF